MVAFPRARALAFTIAIALAAAIVPRVTYAAPVPNLTAASPPKVILFIVADDLGWDDVGFRSHQINTPTIDGLRHDGLVLDHYYVQDVCSPSRATFLTGRYPLHNTVNDWLQSPS